MPPNNDPRYSQIIAKIFETKFREGRRAIRFERTEIVSAARALEIELPKNLGDVIYSLMLRMFGVFVMLSGVERSRSIFSTCVSRRFFDFAALRSE